MKKHLFSYILLFISGSIAAQETFQASLQPVPAASAVTVMLKTSAAKTGKVSSLTIAIAIPDSVGARPSITSVDNSANPYIAYQTYDAINQSIGGATHYIYNILGTGDVVPAAATANFQAGVDTPVVRINFGGGTAIASQLKMVSLPNGGTDLNANSYFGLSIDGDDVVNLAAMFYSIPGMSNAVNDGNGYSGTSYAETLAPVVLPVKFSGFSVSKNNNDAFLTWQIENESASTAYYEIERSLNSADFTKLATVPAKNNGHANNRYDITDVNLSSIQAAGIFYYRIKQVDKDGHYIYSSIKSVRLNRMGAVISLYPNPVKQYTTLNIDVEEDATAIIAINDAAGRQVQNSKVRLFKGPNIKRINFSRYATGNYTIKVQTQAGVRTMAVVKVK